MPTVDRNTYKDIRIPQKFPNPTLFIGPTVKKTFANHHGVFIHLET